MKSAWYFKEIIEITLFFRLNIASSVKLEVICFSVTTDHLKWVPVGNQARKVNIIGDNV